MIIQGWVSLPQHKCLAEGHTSWDYDRLALRDNLNACIRPSMTVDSSHF